MAPTEIQATDVTAVVLTLNEAPNIERTLAQLGWCRRVTIIDSGSTDGTPELAARFPNLDVRFRQFDTFAGQCNYAVRDTGIETEWILSLDADYFIPSELAVEMQHAIQRAPPEVCGFRAQFDYAIQGEVIRSGIYPPRIVLYRRGKAEYSMDGHAHRVSVSGAVNQLRQHIIHDDRKPLHRWLSSQASYAVQEARIIRESASLGLRRSRWLRKWLPISPLLVGAHCLFVRGGLLDGRYGWLYAIERMIAELLIQYELTRQRLGMQPNKKTEL